MILEAFSKQLKKFDNNIPPITILSKWVIDILSKKPVDNVEKVIHKELCIAKNKMGLFIIVGKSKTGIKLLESLYNFALSYEQQNFSRWLHKVKASDFKNM